MVLRRTWLVLMPAVGVMVFVDVGLAWCVGVDEVPAPGC
jgi:hypothetical protein